MFNNLELVLPMVRKTIPQNLPIYFCFSDDASGPNVKLIQKLLLKHQSEPVTRARPLIKAFMGLHL